VTTDETVDWLVQEISDLLDVSRVGLYEFMEFLNDPDRSMPVDEKRSVARRALERLLQDKGVDLHRLQWPHSDNGVISLNDLPADPWSPPDENGDYIGIDRVSA
jgi:hypothetical protein